MNLVDSSGWLEYFASAENADFFAAAIEDTENLVVSPINVYEVAKKILSQRDENAAVQAIAILEQGNMVDLSAEIALLAAQIGTSMKIPMADSMILATDRASHATLWTQDVDFEGVEGVEYIKKAY